MSILRNFVYNHEDQFPASYQYRCPHHGYQDYQRVILDNPAYNQIVVYVCPHCSHTVKADLWLAYCPSCHTMQPHTGSGMFHTCHGCSQESVDAAQAQSYIEDASCYDPDDPETRYAFDCIFAWRVQGVLIPQMPLWQLRAIVAHLLLQEV